MKIKPVTTQKRKLIPMCPATTVSIIKTSFLIRTDYTMKYDNVNHKNYKIYPKIPNLSKTSRFWTVIILFFALKTYTFKPKTHDKRMNIPEGNQPNKHRLQNKVKGP